MIAYLGDAARHMSPRKPREIQLLFTVVVIFMIKSKIELKLNEIFFANFKIKII